MNEKKVDELVGADPNALKAKIEQWKAQTFNPFASGGNLLGSTSATEDPREARLRKLAGEQQQPPPPAPATQEDDEDASLAKALALSEQALNEPSSPSFNEEILNIVSRLIAISDRLMTVK